MSVTCARRKGGKEDGGKVTRYACLREGAERRGGGGRNVSGGKEVQKEKRKRIRSKEGRKRRRKERQERLEVGGGKERKGRGKGCENDGRKGGSMIGEGKMRKKLRGGRAGN